MNKVKQAFDFFISRNWTPEQSAGIVANLQLESGMRPDAVGDGGAAYGLPQWHQPRPRKGESILGSTFEQQLQYIDDELRARSGATDESKAAFLLAQCDTPESAAAIFCRHYERPADIAGDSAKRAALAKSIFQQYASDAPIPTQPEPASNAPAPDLPPPQPERPMAPLLFLPAILEIVPSLLAIFGKGEKGAKNAQAAQIVVNAFKSAVPGALNEQDAIQKVEADPALKAQVKAAVMADPAVLGLIEVGGGVKEARMADLAWANAPAPFYRSSPVFWISLILLPMVVWYVGSSIAGGVAIPAEWPWYAQMPLKLLGGAWDAGARVGLANLVVGLVLGGICGVYFGVSVTQNNQRRSTDSPQQNQ